LVNARFSFGGDVDEVGDELGLQGLDGGLDGLQVVGGDVERGAFGDHVGVHALFSPCVVDAAAAPCRGGGRLC